MSGEDAADDKVRRLRQKRRLMQARLRRANESREFRMLAVALRATGVRRISRLPPAGAAALVTRFAGLPARDERFHWPEIPAGACVGWSDADDRDRWFIHALGECFDPSARLACIFHTAESALVLGRQDAMAHAGRILDPLKQTLWVTPTTPADCLVEVSFIDRQVCWLPGPGRGETPAARPPAGWVQPG